MWTKILVTLSIERKNAPKYGHKTNMTELPNTCQTIIQDFQITTFNVFSLFLVSGNSCIFHNVVIVLELFKYHGKTCLNWLS